MAGIFVNYRSKDQPLGAAAIHDHLARKFGQERVFRDCVSMKAGERYPDELRAALLSADVLLAVVGPDWVTIAEGGERLIDRESDWVRYEIAAALRNGITILPVLLKDTPASAGRISVDDVPADLREFAFLQSFEFSQRRFGAALDELTARVIDLVPSLASNLESPAAERPVASSAATTTTRDVHIAGNGVIGINNGGVR
jgi:hypothetical protein